VLADIRTDALRRKRRETRGQSEISHQSGVPVRKYILPD
jgi:hypothetical protein